jgi:hypothetical protein
VLGIMAEGVEMGMSGPSTEIFERLRVAGIDRFQQPIEFSSLSSTNRSN